MQFRLTRWFSLFKTKTRAEAVEGNKAGPGGEICHHLGQTTLPSLLRHTGAEKRCQQGLFSSPPLFLSHLQPPAFQAFMQRKKALAP